MIRYACYAITVAVILTCLCPGAICFAERPMLTIGSLRSLDALPFARLKQNESLTFSLYPQYQDRSEPFPALNALPDVASELPDIVNALVAYRHNDLKQLVDHDVIVPLDDALARIGIDPKTFLPPNVYAAVEYKGHIWALPHRLQLFVLTWDKAVVEKMHLNPNVQTWDDVAAEAQKILDTGVPSPYDQPLSEGAGLSKEHHVAFFISMLETNPGSAAGFFAKCIEKGIFGTGRMSMTAPITLQGLSTVDSGRTVTPAPAAGRFSMSDPPANPIGYIECYALRKNSPEKIQAATDFLKWLVQENTQLALIKESTPDLPYNQRSLGYCHVPLYTPVLASKAYNDLRSKNTFYAAMAEVVPLAQFACPAQGDYIEINRQKYESAIEGLLDGSDMFSRMEAAGRLITELEAEGKDTLEPASLKTDQSGYDKY